MKLSELQAVLKEQDSITFMLPNGTKVASHFHVTEVGLVTKHFIDCGGVERIEKKISLQLWEADDFDHRLQAEKLISIIELSKEKLGLGDLDVEVEYQGETIGRYGLSYQASALHLVSTNTACLAQDACGVEPKVAFDLSDMSAKTNCTPGGGCC